MSAIEPATAERMIGLLEALLAEHRAMAERQRDALANHAAAIAAQHAQSRQALHWFGAFILAFGALAAVTHSWHPLVQYFGGG